MPRDSRLYMTFTDDTGLSPFHRNIHPSAYVYVVAWETPRGEIVKVGETWRASRWRRFLSTGARVVLIIRTGQSEALDLECRIQDRLSECAPRAFASREDSSPFLGKLGGWMECYRISSERAARIVEEAINGLVQSR